MWRKIFPILFLFSLTWADEQPTKHNIDQIMEQVQNQDSSFISSQDDSTPKEDYAVVLKKTAFTIVGLMVMVFLTIFFLRRFSSHRNFQTNHLKHIKIIEKRSLSPKTILYLVEIGGKKMVLSESQLETRAITEIKDFSDEE